MKTLLLTFLLSSTLFIASPIYKFKVDGLSGGTINFNDFKGKKILIVNTASKCGYTPQYEELEALYKKYGNKIAVVGFPANNFKEQESGSNEEIAAFCQKNYGVTFPMSKKVSVKGDDMAPIYKYLVAEARKKGIEDPVKWNFTKFLIDEKGQLITVFPSKVKPMSDDILKYLN